MKALDDIENNPVNPTQKVEMGGAPAEQETNVLATVPREEPKVIEQAPAKYNTLEDINTFMYGDKRKKLEDEEKEAERKKRSHAIISSIGSGLSALSNLYFTTRGAPNVKQTDHIGRFVKEYNDAKEKRQRLKDQLNARMEEAMRGDLLNRQRAAEIKAQREREDAIRKETWARDDDRYNKELEYRTGRDDVHDKQWGQQFEQGVKQYEETLKLQKGKLEADSEYRGEAIKKAIHDKFMSGSTEFVRENGDKIAVPGSVWKGSMGRAFDVLLGEMKDTPEYKEFKRESRGKKVTNADKDTFLKQHWYKYPRTKEYIELMAGIRPLIDEEPDDVPVSVPSVDESDDYDFEQYVRR